MITLDWYSAGAEAPAVELKPVAAAAAAPAAAAAAAAAVAATAKHCLLFPRMFGTALCS